MVTTLTTDGSTISRTFAAAIPCDSVVLTAATPGFSFWAVWSGAGAGSIALAVCLACVAFIEGTAPVDARSSGACGVAGAIRAGVVFAIDAFDVCISSLRATEWPRGQVITAMRQAITATKPPPIAAQTKGCNRIPRSFDLVASPAGIRASALQSGHANTLPAASSPTDNRFWHFGQRRLMTMPHQCEFECQSIPRKRKTQIVRCCI